MRTRNDKVAIAVIWLIVLLGALLIGAGSSDPGGVGEVAGAVGIALTAAYFRLQRAQSFEELIPKSDAPVGAATAAWVRTVVMFLLWIAGSVIFIVLGLRDGYALVLGALLPLAAYLGYRWRRAAGHA